MDTIRAWDDKKTIGKFFNKNGKDVEIYAKKILEVINEKTD